ncbi:kinase non-catalytic C-lobe domain-containing protein 1-like isoform X1 [Glandiceps talaboti]
MTLSATGLLEFDPLPTLQEDEELVTLSDILQLRDSCLFESEIWAVCRETCLALNSIQSTSMELFTTLCIAPETLAFNTTGSVCFIDSIDVTPDQRYLPPEYEKFGNSVKGHLYSLGNTLWSSIEYNLPDTLELEISDQLCDLLTRLGLESIRERPTLDAVLNICDEQLVDQSSRTICLQLSSIGLRILSVESLNNTEIEEDKIHLLETNRGTDVQNGDLYDDNDSISEDSEELEEISKNYSERRNDKATMDNGRHGRIARTNAHLAQSGGDEKHEEGSGNALAAFDQLSRRAQEILNKLYSPKTISGNLSDPSSPRSTASNESHGEASITADEQTSEQGKQEGSKIPVPRKKYTIDPVQLKESDSVPSVSEAFASRKYRSQSDNENAAGKGFTLVSVGGDKSSKNKPRTKGKHLEKKLHYKAKSKSETDNAKSVKRILELRNRPLVEEELWAVCRECVEALSKSRGVLPSYISLTSTLIKENGSISYKSISADTSLESMYLAPELQDQGILNEKTCLFGVGATLWSAADWRLTPTQQPDISEDLETLFVNMTQDHADDRQDLEDVTMACDQHEEETGAQSTEICQQLWKEAHHFEVKGQTSDMTNLSEPYISKETEDTLLKLPPDTEPTSAFIPITVEKPTPQIHITESLPQYIAPLKLPAVQNLGVGERPSAFKSPGMSRKSIGDINLSYIGRGTAVSEGSISPSSSTCSKDTMSPVQGPIPSKKNLSTSDLSGIPDKPIDSIVDLKDSQSLISNRRSSIADFRLPNAYSSQATHFAPIVLQQEKSGTGATQRKHIMSPNMFKQKMAKAMKLELLKPRPPVNIVQDLEKDASQDEGSDKGKDKSGSRDRSGKKKSRSRSKSPRSRSKSPSRHTRSKDSQSSKKHDKSSRKEKNKKRTDAVYVERPKDKKGEIEDTDIKKDDEYVKNSINSEQQNTESQSALQENQTVSQEISFVSQGQVDSQSGVKGEGSNQGLPIGYPAQDHLVIQGQQQNIMNSPQQAGVQMVNQQHIVPTMAGQVQNPTFQMPVQMQNLPQQQQLPGMQQSPTTQVNVQHISPAQSGGSVPGSPGQNIATNPSVPVPGMFPNYPFQVALQQDPNTGLFHMVPIGIPFSGFSSTQSTTTPQLSGIQQFPNLPFQPQTLGLQYNPALGQFTIPSNLSSPTDSQIMKNLQANDMKVKLTPTETTETDTDDEPRNRDNKSREYSRKKRDRVHYSSHSKKQHRRSDSSGHVGSDSESSESSPSQKSGASKHNTNTSDRQKDEKQEKSESRYTSKSKVDHKTLRVNARRNILEDLDDTKPLENTKGGLTSPTSPTSMSSLSRDSGVHMQANLSSTEEVVSLNDQHLMDVLSTNSVLKKVIKLIRETYAFDGYLENGVEDLAMAEYITSLANLKWATFSSAVSEKFCDLYWEEEVLEQLFEAVNGHKPVITPRRPRSPRPTTLTKTIAENVIDNTASATAISTPDDEDTFSSNDDDDVIDDLLCGYEPSVSPTPSTCSRTSAVMKSKVVADAKLFLHDRERSFSDREKEHVFLKSDQKESNEIEDDEIENPELLNSNGSSAIESLSDLIRSLSTEGEVNEEQISNNETDECQTENVTSEVDDVTRPSLERQQPVYGDFDDESSGHTLDPSMKTDDLNKSTMSLGSTSSGPRFIRVKSASENSDESNVDGPHVPEVGEHRFRKSPLPNPMTIRRSSSLGDSDSSTGSKKGKLRKAISRTLSRHNSSASSSASSGMSRPGSRGATMEDDSSFSMSSSAADKAAEMAKTRPNSAMFFDTEAVDPLIVDYTGQLGETGAGDKQQSIEAKISEVEQQLMMEYRMKAKSEKFYRKLIESQKGKGADQKNMASKVGKQIAEMNKKIDFLESAKRHLEMLYAEQWGLDHGLLYSFASCASTEPMQLEPSSENPLLVFQTSRDGNILQAGTPVGLFSYLFARQALLEGYLHHFFYTYRYFATAKEIFKFVTERFNSALSVSVEQQENRMKVHCRAIDIIQVWIEGFYDIDFKTDSEMTQQLVHFIKYKVIPVDPQGECLLKLIEKHQNQVEETANGMLMYDNTMAEEDRPMTLQEPDRAPAKKAHSFRAALGLPKRGLSASKKERSKVGVISCLSSKDSSKGQSSGVYLPSQSMERDWFSLSEHLTNTLAYQLTLMQQDFFSKVHAVHFMNSRAYGVGVESTTNPLFRRTAAVSQSKLDIDQTELPEVPNSSGSLFVNHLHSADLIVTLLDYARMVSHWVSCEILCCSSVKAQVALLSKFIHMAKTCYDIRNYDTCVQIMEGLDNVLVKQVPAWRNLPSKVNSIMQELTAAKMFLKSDSQCLVEGESHRDQPTLPSTLLFLMHVQQLEIGSFTLANGMFKWTKMKTIGKLIDQIRVFKERHFNFEADPELQLLIRQRIMEFQDQDLHMLASQQLTNFHHGEKSSRKFHDALKKVRASLQ